MSYVAGSLQERSEIYYERAGIYEELSRAEDAEGKVFDFLLPRVRGLDLLDVGCGTGKYVELFRGAARHVTGIDASPAQLSIARGKAGSWPDVELILGDASQADLSMRVYGVAIACWMLGTVVDPRKRLAIVERVLAKLAPGSTFYLVENDSFGEFEAMRGRCADSAAYGLWLEGVAGFERLAGIESRFMFASRKDASRVMGEIWGPKVGALAASASIEHRIAIWGRRSSGG